ncbi:hypothetical protein KA005_04020 [bacterium]|nr:hypothetical protein [bacterium]
MGKFNVNGQAHGVVDVQLTGIEADSKKEAMEKAKEIFARGEHGSIKYSDDDAACFDFVPFYSEEL